MTLHYLIPTLASIPAVADIHERLTAVGPARKSEPVRLLGVPTAARAPLIATQLEGRTGASLIVTSRSDHAEALATALNEYLPEDRPAVVWTTPEALPYEQLPFDAEASAAKVALLDQLRREEQGPAAVIATVRGLVQLLMPPDELAQQTWQIRPGDRLDIDRLLQWATRVGYSQSPLVQEPGTIARRGGLVDIFVPGTPMPVRLDFFGDEVDSIRAFDPGTQRSQARQNAVSLLPPAELPLWNLKAAANQLERLDTTSLRDEVRREWERMLDQIGNGQLPASVDLLAPYLMKRSATLLDYFRQDALVVLDEPSAIRMAAQSLMANARELLAGFEVNGELPRGLRQPFADWDAIQARGSAHPMLSFGGADSGTELDEISDAPLFAGRLAALVDMVGQRLANTWSVVIATDQVDRLTELFEEQGIYPRRSKRGADESQGTLPISPGSLDIRASDLSGGWELDAKQARLLVLTDFELFGFRKTTRRGYRRSTSDAGSYAADFTPGEIVVHIDHGIAKFVGLVRMSTAGVEREYMLLEYAKGDKLYVPVDQSDRVSRYSGGGAEATLSKLGSGEWVRTKQRVRRAVREMAWELIQLYASRETVKGYQYPPDSVWDIELAESFPYQETPDQLKAINDVKADMESERPMDRLVCGDVGFGKTEVALRAAFKAANAGKQVAILVPTTVLALQHYQTFRQRLAAFPVRVEMLSRLRTKQEQRAILTGLANGTIDIVIGTHRLVQEDVKFKDVGLVIIDEEQRFGVRQKEHFKRLRTEVDVISMSATPIPRTLHMSLAGIRDISVIDTAPQERLPVRTFVTEFNDTLVREVILRELERGGQVYFVHNRVHDIDRLAHKLRQLVPEARFGIGHGQMDERVLEEIVLSFIRHEFDVLVSTTIIESGVDIPNVNTIIIDDADTLGLTQLYQLRGRVGRSTNRAYAYLLYRPTKVLSDVAQERLEAIQEATELGAGMRVAMRDLEIRGAGNILGAEQSGHIAAIGFDLYLRLLSQAVEEISKGRPTIEINPVQLDLPLTALIPADYIVDTELRLATYRKIAAVGSFEALAEMRRELVDRFGPIPDEVEHLLALIAVRLRSEQLGIESIVEREREIVIRPVLTNRLDQRRLKRTLGQAVKLTPNSVRIRLMDLDIPWEQALDTVLDTIEEANAMGEISADGSGRGTPRTTTRELVGAGPSAARARIDSLARDASYRGGGQDLGQE